MIENKDLSVNYIYENRDKLIFEWTDKNIEYITENNMFKNQYLVTGCLGRTGSTYGLDTPIHQNLSDVITLHIKFNGDVNLFNNVLKILQKESNIKIGCSLPPKEISKERAAKKNYQLFSKKLNKINNKLKHEIYKYIDILEILDPDISFDIDDHNYQITYDIKILNDTTIVIVDILNKKLLNIKDNFLHELNNIDKTINIYFDNGKFMFTELEKIYNPIIIYSGGEIVIHCHKKTNLHALISKCKTIKF